MQKTLLGLAFATALSATATASDSSWLALDQEISNLSTTVVADHGFGVSGFMTTVFDSNSDSDTQGWSFEAIRLNFTGSVEGIDVKVSGDMAGGTLDLRDAYAAFDVADGINLRIGQGKIPFLYSFNVSGGSQLFIDRTENGQTSTRDRGAMFSGALGDMGSWAAGIFNGADGTTEEHRMTARASFDVMGGGAFGKHEGGVDFFGAEGTHASVAVAMDDDEDAGGDSRVAFELAATMSNFWLHIDMVDSDANDNAPMGITASYMFQEDVELAFRMEDRDDAADSSAMTIGANYYQALPHTVKWHLQYRSISSDVDADETDTISLGLTVNL